MKIRAAFWLPALLGLGVDLLSKHLMFALLPEKGQRLPILRPLLVLQHEENTGGVFGVLRGRGYVFAVLSVIAIGAIFWMLRKADPRQRLLPVALGLVAAGAVGNLVDRLWLGYVRDFIYVEIINWPAFNIADSCICVAAGLLVIEIFRAEARDKREAKDGPKR